VFSLHAGIADVLRGGSCAVAIAFLSRHSGPLPKSAFAQGLLFGSFTGPFGHRIRRDFFGGATS